MHCESSFLITLFALATLVAGPAAPSRTHRYPAPAGRVSMAIQRGDVRNWRISLARFTRPTQTAGEPPNSANVISPDEMRLCLQIFESVAVRDCPGGQQTSFNPLQPIRAANKLLPEGKEKILAAAEEWMRAGGDVDAIVPVLQILFEPTATKPLTQRDMFPYGHPSFPADVMRTPRYPLMFLRDVPVLAYFVDKGGIHQTGDEIPWLDYIRKNVRLREHPLRPPDNRLELAAEFEASDQWLWAKKYRTADNDLGDFLPSEPLEVSVYKQIDGRSIVRYQLLHMIATAYPTGRQYLPRQEGKNTAIKRLGDYEWFKCVCDVDVLNLHWDANANDYKARPLH